MNVSIQAGAPATVGSLANATGGIKPGSFVDTDIDQQLFQFNSDDTLHIPEHSRSLSKVIS